MPEVSLARNAGIKKPSKMGRTESTRVHATGLGDTIQSSSSFGIFTFVWDLHSQHAGNPTVAKVAGMKNESK